MCSNSKTFGLNTKLRQYVALNADIKSQQNGSSNGSATEYLVMEQNSQRLDSSRSEAGITLLQKERIVRSC